LNPSTVYNIKQPPFGSLLPGRQANSGDYKYGFNGKENDNEVKGTGNQQDYGFRIYDPRLAKFLSVDPLTKEYPWYTPYQFAGNMPIEAIDLDGLEPKSKKEGDNSTSTFLNTLNQIGFKDPLRDLQVGGGEAVLGFVTNTAKTIIAGVSPTSPIRQEVANNIQTGIGDAVNQTSRLGINSGAEFVYNLVLKSDVNGLVEAVKTGDFYKMGLHATNIGLTAGTTLLPELAGMNTSGISNLPSIQSTKLISPYEFVTTHPLTKSKTQYNKLKLDIKTNGILEPIKYVESGGAKLLGHHRLKISKELGMKTIPSQKVNLPYKGYKTSKDLEYSFD
jgi:RHS repeat-associated protein